MTTTPMITLVPGPIRAAIAAAEARVAALEAAMLTARGEWAAAVADADAALEALGIDGTPAPCGALCRPLPAVRVHVGPDAPAPLRWPVRAA